MKKLLMSVLMAAALPAGALAQAWPDKPITVVVPFGAGGGVDAAARIVMPKLSERLGQQVMIENVPGASGTIGTQRVAKAKPDGNTLLFAVASPINVAPLVAPASVRYDALQGPGADRAGGRVALRAGRQARPAGRHHRRTAGAGAQAAGQADLRHRRLRHLAARHRGDDHAHRRRRHPARALQVRPAGADRRRRRPGGPGGAAGGAGAGHGQGGQGASAYGVTSKARSDALPGVPSLSETPALATLDVESWMGLLGPAGLDPAIVARLNKEVAARAGRPGGAEATGRRRHEADADGAGGFRCVPAARAQGAGRHGERRQHQGGMRC